MVLGFITALVMALIVVPYIEKKAVGANIVDQPGDPETPQATHSSFGRSWNLHQFYDRSRHSRSFRNEPFRPFQRKLWACCWGDIDVSPGLA